MSICQSLQSILNIASHSQESFSFWRLSNVKKEMCYFCNVELCMCVIDSVAISLHTPHKMAGRTPVCLQNHFKSWQVVCPEMLFCTLPLHCAVIFALLLLLALTSLAILLWPFINTLFFCNRTGSNWVCVFFSLRHHLSKSRRRSVWESQEGGCVCDAKTTLLAAAIITCLTSLTSGVLAILMLGQTVTETLDLEPLCMLYVFSRGHVVLCLPSPNACLHTFTYLRDYFIESDV